MEVRTSDGIEQLRTYLLQQAPWHEPATPVVLASGETSNGSLLVAWTRIELVYDDPEKPTTATDIERRTRVSWFQLGWG